MIRLIAAGHTPADAEAWARSLRCFDGVTRDHLTSFATHVAGLWSYRAATGEIPESQRRARITREYAAWCLAALGVTGTRHPQAS